MRAALPVLLLLAAAEAQAPARPAGPKPPAGAAAPAPLVALKADLARVEAQLAAHEQAQKERDRLARSKGAISGMTMDDMLAMQKLLDRKAELEKLISNAMRASSDPANPASRALKAS